METVKWFLADQGAMRLNKGNLIAERLIKGLGEQFNSAKIEI